MREPTSSQRIRALMARLIPVACYHWPGLWWFTSEAWYCEEYDRAKLSWLRNDILPGVVDGLRRRGEIPF